MQTFCTCLALENVISICLVQVRSDEIQTPRYLKITTSSIWCPFTSTCMEGDGQSQSGDCHAFGVNGKMIIRDPVHNFVDVLLKDFAV